MSALPPARLPDDEYQALHPVAFALRKQGFIPLQRLWIHRDALPEILAITDRYSEAVNGVRDSVKKNSSRCFDSNPATNKEAAWEEAKRRLAHKEIYYD